MRAIVLGIVLLLAACGAKPKAGACKLDSDCKDGRVCVENTCVECRDTTDCKDGKPCQAGACVAAACMDDKQCPADESCIAGVCRACTADAECGAGGRCEKGRCERATTCTKDEDCQDDEDCVAGYCQRTWMTSSTDATCKLESIYFAHDDAGIAADARAALDRNNTCLLQQTGTVTVVGHTDESGTDEYNIALSQRRGQTVADYLQRLGIDATRLHVVPRGETEPSGQGADKDRRVEFQWK